MHFNAVYNGSEVTHYRDASLFTSGKSHYERLFKDIRSAKKCIYVEFYTIHHDPVGEAFVNELAKKAREGVEVLVMCDFIANLSTPRKMFDPLTHAGGQVIRVKPYLTHYRSHRKIVVIDHEISYIGGMNIGKQYANMAKVKNPWRDTQVRLEGVCSLVLEKYFLTDWLCSVKRSGRSDAVHRPSFRISPARQGMLLLPARLLVPTRLIFPERLRSPAGSASLLSAGWTTTAKPSKCAT